MERVFTKDTQQVPEGSLIINMRNTDLVKDFYLSWPVQIRNIVI